MGFQRGEGRGVRRVWPVGVLLCVLLLPGCFRHAARGPGPEAGARPTVPAGALFAPSASFTFALFLPKSAAPLLPEVAGLIRQRYPALRLLGEGEQEAPPPTVRVTERTTGEYPLPEGELLEMAALRLSAREQARLATAERVLLLEFTTAPPGLEAVRQASALAHELALSGGGLLWDEEVGELLSADGWRERRLETWANGEPFLANHFNAYLYAEGVEGAHFLTVGLAKFGLPELEMKHIPEALKGQGGMLLNLVAQLMLEGVPVREGGGFPVELDALKFTPLRQQLQREVPPEARQRLLLGLTLTEPEEGGAGHRRVEILFPSHLGDTPTQRARAALAELFGARSEVVPTQHDEELLAASQRAREQLLHRVKLRFQEGLEPGARLLVKAPFDTASGGSEWMWVLVTGWEGAAVQGVLESEPEEVPGLRAGAPVTVEEDSLFDYLLLWPDGTSEGNETERLILQRAGQR